MDITGGASCSQVYVLRTPQLPLYQKSQKKNSKMNSQTRNIIHSTNQTPIKRTQKIILRFKSEAVYMIYFIKTAYQDMLLKDKNM